MAPDIPQQPMGGLITLVDFANEFGYTHSANYQCYNANSLNIDGKRGKEG